MAKSLTMWVAMAVLMVVATGCYEVVYTVEHKGDSCIKFEDAMYYDEALEEWVDACLGEDGVEEADEFIVELSGATDEVEVTVKSGKCKKTVSLVWDEYYEVWWAEACGFIIAGEPYEVDTDEDDIADEFGWDLGVISDTDNETAALSHITFCFGDDVTVIGPEEGSYTVNRGSDYDEPTEPEEEEEEEEEIEGLRFIV